MEKYPVLPTHLFASDARYKLLPQHTYDGNMELFGVIATEDSTLITEYQYGIPYVYQLLRKGEVLVTAFKRIGGQNPTDNRIESDCKTIKTFVSNLG